MRIREERADEPPLGTGEEPKPDWDGRAIDPYAEDSLFDLRRTPHWRTPYWRTPHWRTRLPIRWWWVVVGVGIVVAVALAGVTVWVWLALGAGR